MRSKNRYQIPCDLAYLRATLSDARFHNGPLLHAIDFILREGTAVYAALDGIVVDMKMDSFIGGPDPEFVRDANYITLQHVGGEFSEYVHLQHASGIVDEGDYVGVGQLIARSGNTGYSTTPHLHFHVGRSARTTLGWRTIEPIFMSDIPIDRISVRRTAMEK
ncbi:TPA: M23 family metallopeptidase [Candidatus Woesearchaeota archaeon]|nr:M23 family metallopeptidase [Candidatus Woesearchaeota archaeon]